MPPSAASQVSFFKGCRRRRQPKITCTDDIWHRKQWWVRVRISSTEPPVCFMSRRRAETPVFLPNISIYMYMCVNGFCPGFGFGIWAPGFGFRFRAYGLGFLDTFRVLASREIISMYVCLCLYFYFSLDNIYVCMFVFVFLFLSLFFLLRYFTQVQKLQCWAGWKIYGNVWVCEQIRKTQAEPQWIVAQRLLSALTIPGFT